ncbi:MAG: 3-oxoacyl-[acyl-carrier-protein] synthase III C-terminal domain-containing protein [Puia sp.]
MGTRIDGMHALFGDETNSISSQSKTVFHLAEQCLPFVMQPGISYSHLFTATSCPDSISPSLGQSINQNYNQSFSHTHSIDIVQGCTGGVSAMIHASQLAEINKSHVLVVASDAAKKATSVSSEVYHVFKNGVFGCNISYTEENTGLIYSKSCQYKDLFEVVTIRLGHDADAVILENISEMLSDPRKHLGLRLNNRLALKLMQKAERFYLEFIAESVHPDILILHQVNVMIINHLQTVFEKYPVEFINIAEESGNCGCATTGIALNSIKKRVSGKKVMICSFGTGGVIIAGLWQF